MGLINEVRIKGRATCDPIRSGRGPHQFSIAFGGLKKRDSEERWPTQFFDVTCWSDTAAAEVRKGREIVVVGKLRQHSWEKDGKKYSRVGIVADEITEPELAEAPKQPSAQAKSVDARRFPIPPQPVRERKVAEVRPVTEQDPITDGDIPW